MKKIPFGSPRAGGDLKGIFCVSQKIPFSWNLDPLRFVFGGVFLLVSIIKKNASLEKVTFSNRILENPISKSYFLKSVLAESDFSKLLFQVGFGRIRFPKVTFWNRFWQIPISKSYFLKSVLGESDFSKLLF